MYHWQCGDSLFRKYKKKNLVLSGTEMAHKWFRIASSETIPIYFQKGQSTEVNTFPNPHHNSTNISVKNGENQGHKINWIKQGNLEIFTVSNHSRIASKCDEYRGRQSLNTGKGLFKVELQ